MVKPPHQNGITNSDKTKLMRKSGPRMAVKVVVMTATRDDHLGGVVEYNRLRVYHDENTTTSLVDRPLLGWKPYICFEFVAHAKFQNPAATSFGQGVFTPHLRTLDRSAHPAINMFGNVSAHMSAKSPSNISEVSELYNNF